MLPREAGPLHYVFPSNPPFDKVVAAFTIRNFRRGKLFSDGLNTGLHTGDDPINVIENRRLIFETLGFAPDSFTCGKQVHRDTVHRVTSDDRGRGATDYDDSIPDTDALITNVPGIPIGVFTADCVPVFLYYPESPAVGVVHAGWRSTALSIVKKTVQKMEAELGVAPEGMWASIGPSIGPCCYEVGQDVLDEFRRQFDYADALFRATATGKWHLDLWLANRMQLAEAGLCEERITNPRICSACNSDRYFSARKLSARAGRTLSVIAIKPWTRA